MTDRPTRKYRLKDKWGLMLAESNHLSGIGFSPVSRDRREMLIRFLVLSTIVLLLLAFVGTVALRIQLGIDAAEAEANNKASVTLASNLARHDFDTVLADLTFLAMDDTVRDLVHGEDTRDARLRVANQFFNLAFTKGLYDQVRLLDAKGMEKVRVDLNDGNPVVVPEDALQDKSDRYYFKETIALPKGHIYISPIDLNVEDGRIEEPYKPMIRFGMPLYDRSENFRGIVVLNYLGGIFLDKFRKQMSLNRGLGMIVNQDGYWLSSPDPEDEWGFMFGNDRTFAKKHPKAWAKIVKGESGQFETAEGLFTFSTVQPLTDLKIHDTTTGHMMGEWKIISITVHENLTLGLAWNRLTKLYPLLAVIPISLIGCWFYSRASVGRRMAEHGLRLAYETLELKVHERTRELLDEAKMRKLTEDHLRKLSQAVEQSPTTVVITDTEGTIEYVNPKFVEATGYSAEEAIGQNPRILKSGLTTPEEYRGLWKTITSGNEWQGEFRNRRKDGSLYWEQAFISPIKSTDGTITHFLAVKEDTTERRRTEEALRRSQKMESVGQLTGGIAHDFNNLLGIIIGNLDFLVREIDEQGSARKRVDAALKSALRGADLTKRLLAFSRQEHQAPKVVNINAVIAGIEDMVRKTLTAAIAVDTDLAADLWLANLDPGDLEDVFLNLALNARDAMPGGGHLAVETRNVTVTPEDSDSMAGLKPGAYVKLTVSDDGCGIPKDTLEKVFDPFFTTKMQGKGTGLGLSMVYGFVKRSNGHVDIYSEVGVGTKFKIYLPAVVPGGGGEGSPSADETSVKRNDETILVVDDEEQMRKLAEDWLSELGYRTVFADDADQALKILADDQKIDLLFSDVVMPGDMDGYELAKKARERWPDLKVLLTSGFTKNGQKREDHQDLKLDLLAKPYRKWELAKHVRKVLDA